MQDTQYQQKRAEVRTKPEKKYEVKLEDLVTDSQVDDFFGVKNNKLAFQNKGKSASGGKGKRL